MSHPDNRQQEDAIDIDSASREESPLIGNVQVVLYVLDIIVRISHH